MDIVVNMRYISLIRSFVKSILFKSYRYFRCDVWFKNRFVYFKSYVIIKIIVISKLFENFSFCSIEIVMI